MGARASALSRMGLRPTKWHEKRLESRLHPIKWTRLVKVEAALGMSRPWPCLIRSVRLDEQVRKADAVYGIGGSAKRCLIFSPVRSPSLVRKEQPWRLHTR